MHYYFEKSTYFPHKVIDSVTGRPQWRVSVDMGLHFFLKNMERETLVWLDLGLLTGSIIALQKTQMKEAFIVVKQLLNGLQGSVTIMDSDFVPNATDNTSSFTKEMIKFANEKDLKTTYSLKYWEELEKELEKLRPVEE